MVQLGDIVRVLLHDLLYALLVDVLQVFDLWHLGHIFIDLLEAFDETSQIHRRLLLVATIKAILLIDLTSAIMLVMDCLILTTASALHHFLTRSLTLISHLGSLALIVVSIWVL